ncbi:MAG: hypothetical protein FWD82_08715 [Defluviitaleaceae bacterium]|nr:hypothetical protein [Defluviitaleaceae bacterium]
MKKFKPVKLIAAALAFAVMATTAVVSANNVSGYERLKQAAILTYVDILDADNYTVEMNFSMYLDGERIAYGHSLEMQENEHRRHSQSSSYFMGLSERSEWHNYDGHRHSYSQWDSTYHHWYDANWDRPNTWQRTPSTPTTSELRLVNLGIDLLVGDTKNFFTQSGDTVSVSLGRNQIPEIAQLGMAIFSEQALNHMDRMPTGHNDPQTELFAKFRNIAIDSGWLDATISQSGYVASVNGGITLAGNSHDGARHELVINVDVELRNVGTTVIMPFDETDKVINSGNNNVRGRSLLEDELDMYFAMIAELEELRAELVLMLEEFGDEWIVAEIDYLDELMSDTWRIIWDVLDN